MATVPIDDKKNNGSHPNSLKKDASPSGHSSALRIGAFALPNIVTSECSSIEKINENKIKPTLLARRRAKKLMGNRKGSMVMMGSMHRSSNMSFTTVSHTNHSMPRNGSTLLAVDEDAQ